MKLNWLKNISGTVLALSLIGVGGAIAQEEPNYSEWDSDGNSELSYEEWDAGFDDEGVFETWDADGDGLLSEDEYGEGVFNAYDDNDDTVLEEPEFGDYGDDLGDEGFWDV
ncbi:MAG TPA: hypothetical protein VFM75_07680 [Modicisalibacter sp.]|nr:hypothetical protein [Modicisalibacter sp.]